MSLIKQTVYHSALVMFFISICFLFKNINVFYSFFNNVYICLFLILTVGISHGAVDHIKGKQLLTYYKISSIFIFYVGYSLLSLIVIFLWYFFPNITCLSFLTFASLHFGKEDTEQLIPNSLHIHIFLKYILLIGRGSIVISLPLMFHYNQTIQIFHILNLSYDIPYFFINLLCWFGVICTFLIAFLLKSNRMSFVGIVMDFFSLLILNIIYEPFAAFTIYFCFLHSIRHTLTWINHLNLSSFKLNVITFFKESYVLTLTTSLTMILLLYVLSLVMSFTNSVYNIVFIGLASLTLPHIFLEYLLEKEVRKKNNFDL